MYFGITRYLFICMGTMDSYLEHYRKSKSGTKKYKTVATLQVNNGKEMECAARTIKSLLDQTQPVDAIALYTTLSVPDEYKKVVSVYDTNENHILCSLKREKESDTRIISVIPGKVYAKDLVENLCKASEEKPHCLIHVKGSPRIKGIEYSQGILTRPGIYEEIKSNFDLVRDTKYTKEIQTERAW